MAINNGVDMIKLDYPVGYAFLGLIITFFGAGFFFGTSNIGRAVNDLMLSVFSSYVFFFLTVTLKENSDKNKIKKIVNPMLNRIVNRVYVSIHNSIINPNKNVQTGGDVWSMSACDLSACLDEQLLNAPLKGIRSHYVEYDIKVETYIEQLIVDTTLPLQSIIDNIKPYYYMLDYDTVSLLTEIEGSRYLSFSGRSLKYESKFVFDNGCFIEFFSLIKKLDGRVNIKG
ncbi:hypothetical protein [Aeromonas veronii]|uniref:hypothetical protein n=1 Tax=Aeromonas veronii TaxID=654 RepID=UPI0002807BF4|nr:hypothetical protein [Aeromonas veronii]EKB16405.1 hypothetical protein HMPREF1167_00840 [Aeromonas veronii AER39]